MLDKYCTLPEENRHFFEGKPLHTTYGVWCVDMLSILGDIARVNHTSSAKPQDFPGQLKTCCAQKKDCGNHNLCCLRNVTMPCTTPPLVLFFFWTKMVLIFRFCVFLHYFGAGSVCILIFSINERLDRAMIGKNSYSENVRHGRWKPRQDQSPTFGT